MFVLALTNSHEQRHFVADSTIDKYWVMLSKVISSVKSNYFLVIGAPLCKQRVFILIVDIMSRRVCLAGQIIKPVD